MGNDEHRARRFWRTIGQLGIAVAGVLAILGTGGGGVGGLPGDECSFGCIPPIVPAQRVSISPSSVTVQVGTRVTFTASAIGFASPPAFSWCRAPPNSNLCVLIEGAVDQHYDIASVQLSDDGAQFMVTANGNEGTAHSAFATLHVSSMAAVVYLDGDFLEPGWLAIASAASADAHRFQVLRAAEGGHPGAHRLIHYEITAAARPLRTFHAAIGANYYPTSQGEIYRIDFDEECMARPGEATPVAVPFIEQDSRRFIAAKAAGRCEIDNWVSSARGSLGAEDFSIAEGPACGDGESCPDFSATAAPLRFGFGSIVDNASPPIDNARYVQRVDNWKVTVWRR